MDKNILMHTMSLFFKDKQTGKQTRYRKQTLDFTPPQEFFIAESISTTVAYNLALQLIKRSY